MGTRRVFVRIEDLSISSMLQIDMPRPPTNIHVLQTARKILGLTQAHLALRVGVATVTIQKIEGGKMRLRRKLANKISIATAVDPQQLIENFDPETPYLVMAHPEKLTRENAQARQKPKLDESTLDVIDREVYVLAESMREMLRASVMKGSVWVLLHMLREAVAEAREEFKLPVRTERPNRAAIMQAVAARRRERQSL